MKENVPKRMRSRMTFRCSRARCRLASVEIALTVELWNSLSREEARLESPPWHEEALRETAARHDAGKEQPVDWEAAKRELRKRAE